MPFLTIGNISDGKLSFERTRFVSRSYFTSLDPRRVPRDGDILYTIVGSFGIPVCVDGASEFCVQRHIAMIRPDGTCERDFLYLFLRSPLAYGQAAACATGIAQPTVGLKPLRRFRVPIPPLAEQKRIVAKVDQLMGLIDELEAKQTKKRKVQARFRASALDALTQAEGVEELVEAWKRVSGNWGPVTAQAQNVGLVREAVLRLAVAGTLLGRGPKNDWPIARLGNIVEMRLGKMLDKAKNKGKPRPYLRNTNVRWFSIRLDDIKNILIEDEELAEYALRAGDLLVCEGGHGIGRTAVWRAERELMTFQKALHRLRPTATINSDFLSFQIKVAADSGRLSDLYTGAGIPHLTGRSFARLEVAVPPLAEQKRIVAKVEALMKLCDDLEAKLRAKEETAAMLVEAVVKKLVA